MSLSKIISEIKKLKTFAEESVSPTPVETFANRKGRKNQSIQKIAELKKQYVSEILKSVVFLIATGDKKDLLGMVASEKFSVFNADPEEFYDDLTERVAPVLYQGKENNPSTLETLSRHLEDKALELDIIGYPQLIFKQQHRKLIKTKEDFKAFVKDIINEQMGAEVVGIQSIISVLDDAIERGHSGPTTVIMLSTDDLSLATALSKDLKRLTNSVFVISAGKLKKEAKSLKPSFVFDVKKDEEAEKVDEAAVELFAKIKSAIKKR